MLEEQKAKKLNLYKNQKAANTKKLIKTEKLNKIANVKRIVFVN